MDRDTILGIVILLSIIAISLFGGTKKVEREGFLAERESTSQTREIQEKDQKNIARELKSATKEAERIQAEINKIEEEKKASKYRDTVTLRVNKSTSLDKEYVTLKVSKTATAVNITGWTIKSQRSGVSVQIPQSSYLFFADSPNSEQDVYLNPGDTAFIMTGRSPNGASFRVNKCSGYLEQFQDFTPNLGTSCPRPRDENLSSIPNTVNNEACLDYIERMPSCRIQTKTTPANWSYECTNFIYTKVNYPTCVNNHKNDSDFYENEWRIYLKRNDRLWKERNDTITLLDSEGKIVDTVSY